MAKLATLRRDPAALADGVWIKPDEHNLPDLELRVRGRDAAFYDELSKRYRELVRTAREDGRLKPRQGLDDLPVSTVQHVENTLMLERLVLDVRGLEDDAGPVKIAALRDMALTEEFRPLLDLAREAVAIATDRRVTDRKAAEGNSAKSSATTPPGAPPNS